MIKREKRKSIDELPQDTPLEELRIFYELNGERRQEVLPFAVVKKKKIFRASKNGKVLQKEKFQNIIWLSFIKRF